MKTRVLFSNLRTFNLILDSHKIFLIINCAGQKCLVLDRICGNLKQLQIIMISLLGYASLKF